MQCVSTADSCKSVKCWFKCVLKNLKHSLVSWPEVARACFLDQYQKQHLPIFPRKMQPPDSGLGTWTHKAVHICCEPDTCCTALESHASACDEPGLQNPRKQGLFRDSSLQGGQTSEVALIWWDSRSSKKGKLRHRHTQRKTPCGQDRAQVLLCYLS